ncbi:sensor histidine kinase [Nocardioides ferulae]|uniref:sensor histidine kinase n=1 Tax=Nocardioides ferulae TaxID=2340821 RepID=UPI000EB2D2A9|nr:HAMP domain-containing sensor histidine kinase [Nocardioides ferulae]
MGLTHRLRHRPVTLTARLVAVVVLLVVFAAAAIGVATTVAMRQNLDQRLDADVHDTMRFALGPGLLRPPGEPDDFGPGEPFGTLRAVLLDDGDAGGQVLDEEQDGAGSTSTALDERQLDALADLRASTDPQTVDVPGLGSYRVLVTELDGGRVVAGLPRTEVEQTIADLVWLEVLATIVGVLAAATAGAFVVRRQLAPLRDMAGTAHRVAELPLATGEIALDERVPARLTDDRTEVGQVGNALNTLLDHVESSLTARHRSEQQVRQFVADASHELRTPLATIAGYSELARRHPDDEAALRTALAKVEEESSRMTSLVEDLLLLARLDAGRPLAAETVDLTSLLLEAVADARVLAPEHRWRLDLPDHALEVRGDERRLHQVVTNLLTNARKHTPPGTTVTVRADSSGFSVHDDGPGFAPELAGQAFERFTRGDRARHREGGAGLGLALVEAIVGALGGTVGLDSRPGDTTVTVCLQPR